ncbi:MAG TPA: phosphatase domain-containing protein [Anaeromyxobacteraceae bacterium]|nr:phosphatase domain-containing protein [Anaeromyxobacteraceae bacterium]
MIELLVFALVVLLLPALLLPGLARAVASDLILPPALGRPGTIWVFGRVVSESAERGPRALRALLRLAARNWIGAPVTVRCLGRTATAVTGHDGEFEVELRAVEGEPFPPGWHGVEVEAPGVRGAGTVFVVPPDAPFIVVSDFDDTLAVSHVTSKYRLIATAFFEDADTHPPVDGMHALFRSFARLGPVPPAFAVVTGWPIQFAPRLVRFLAKNGFPPMALFLRNLGRTTLSGYKEPVLRRLVERFPQPLVLVGDSGERDPEIYGALAREHPGRVLRIYIREADEVGPAGRFQGMVLFADPGDAVRDAVAAGLGR